MMRPTAARRLQRALCLVGAIVLALCLSAGRTESQGRTFVGKVVGVTDGDTVSVLQDGAAVRVRLDGIDAPERAQAFSQRARQRLASLVSGRDVTVSARDTDRYGRLVARLVVDGQDVSERLVREGWAWHYVQYSDDPQLAAAEAAAKATRSGLWADANPLPPWEFRRAPTRAQPRTVERQSQQPAGALRGNVRSKVFHRSSCRNYRCKNCTAAFQTREQAITAGYRPAGDCH